MKINIRKLIQEELLRLRVEEAWSGKVKEYLIDPSELNQEYKTKQAIEGFQKYYRTIDTDTQYFFIQWLKKAVLKKLSSEEANNIARQVVASSKGFTAPHNKNI